MEKIGILGAGKLGLTLAQLANTAGFEVGIASSRPASAIELSVSVLAPGTKVMASAQLLAEYDVIVLALPLSRFFSLPKTVHDQFANKIVLDAMNYWWEVDGREQATAYQNSSVNVAARLPEQAKVVKAFNHMGYHDLADEATSDTTAQKGMIYATDHAELVPEIETMIQRLGFAPYYLDSLAKGIALEPGSPLFGANEPKSVLHELLRSFASESTGTIV